MRKIIEYSLLSADGIVNHPNPIEMELGQYQDDAYIRDSTAVFEACDAMIWGRTTYEIFAQVYGHGGGNPAYSARLSAIQKYVFSSKLRVAPWSNSTIVPGDVVEEVTKLKAQAGGNILLLGHGRLAETLLRHRLLDAMDLSIHPLMVGRGQPLLRDGQAVQLKLAATKVYSKIVKLTYEPQY